MMEMQGKPPSVSKVEMAEHVFPNDTNPHGHIFGGRVMALIDVAAAIAATRHSRRATVTASVDEVVFLAPVKMGHVLLLEAIVTEAFSTSMEIAVNVYSENPLTGERRHTTTAFTTFVALDDLGLPTPVPPLLPQTDLERERQLEARERKEARMARRKKLPGRHKKG